MSDLRLVHQHSHALCHAGYGEHSDGNPAATAALAMSASNLGDFCAPAITVAAQGISGSPAVSVRFVVDAFCALAVAALVILMIRRQTPGRIAKTR